MGCGTSNLDASSSTFSARIRRLFNLRLQEIRRSRTATVSKKLLLTNDDVSSRKQPLVRRASDLSTTKESSNTAVQEETEKEVSEECSTNNNNNNNQEKKDEDNNVKDVLEERVQDKEEEEEKEEKEEEEEDDDKRRLCREGNFPGSPSFRIYFVENDKKMKNEDKNDQQDEVLSPISQEGDAALSSLKESVNNPCMKKRRTKRSLKTVIPKAFNLRSLYSSSSSTSSAQQDHCTLQQPPNNSHPLADILPA